MLERGGWGVIEHCPAQITDSSTPAQGRPNRCTPATCVLQPPPSGGSVIGERCAPLSIRGCSIDSSCLDRDTTMVAAAQTFFRYEEESRTAATLKGLLAVLSISIASATVGLAVGFRANGAAIILLSACMVLCIVSTCIAASLIWSLATGRTCVVHITDNGVKWNDHSSDWSAVRRIRLWSGQPDGLTTLTFTVARSGPRSQLAIPIRIPNSTAMDLQDELRAFLAASGYNIRWVN